MLHMTRDQAISALCLREHGYYDYPQVTRYVTEDLNTIGKRHVVIHTRPKYVFDAATDSFVPNGQTSYVYVHANDLIALMQGTLKSFRR